MDMDMGLHVHVHVLDEDQMVRSRLVFSHAKVVVRDVPCLPISNNKNPWGAQVELDIRRATPSGWARLYPTGTRCTEVILGRYW